MSWQARRLIVTLNEVHPEHRTTICRSGHTPHIAPPTTVALAKKSIMMIRPHAAPPPFDNPDADVILRSSDMEPVDFRVFKLLLSISSPFFTEIFTLPQPSSAAPSFYSSQYVDGGGVPVVQMAEDKETLTLLLGLCFPISAHPIPQFSSLQEIHKVTEAAVKFEMKGILNYLREELVSLRFLESQPLRVFAIAFHFGWDTEAKKAARYTLRHHVDMPFVSELEFISGATLHRLREYHTTCGKVASSRVHLQPALAEYDDSWTWITCKKCPSAWRNGSTHRFPDARKLWVVWVENVADAVRHRPWGETVKNCDLLYKALHQSSTCTYCSSRAREDLEVFSQMLSVEIEWDISSVSWFLSNVVVSDGAFIDKLV